MSWQDVIRDVEAGGSNPLTPTNHPVLGTSGEPQPMKSLSSDTSMRTSFAGFAPLLFIITIQK